MEHELKESQPLISTSSWWCIEKTELKKTKRTTPLAQSWINNTASERGEFWTIRYSGDLVEYTPDMRTLGEAMNLALPPTETYMPTDECLEFFKKWGPLGLFDAWLKRHGTYRNSGGDWIVRLDDSEGREFLTRSSAAELPYAEYWKAFHGKGRSDPYLEYEDLFSGYLEHWPLVYRELIHFQLTVMHWQELKIYHSFEDYVRNNISISPSPYAERPFSFQSNSLLGALYGLMANLLLENWLLGKCPTCERYFWTRDSRRIYCDPDCRRRRNITELDKKRKKDPLEKERRRLKSILDRRQEELKERGLEDKTIRLDLNDAKTLDELGAVVKRYKGLFDKKRPGPKHTSDF